MASKQDFLVKIIDYEAIDGAETLVHIRNIGGSDHITVCGMDGGNSGGEHEQIPLKRGDKMNCAVCKIFYDNRKGLNLKKDWLSGEFN